MGGPVLALVPARSGSKEIPRKNLRPLAGRTLLEYVARVARASLLVDRAVLSTDSEEIAEEGRRVGLEVPFLRPPALAADDTPMMPVIEHAIAELAARGFHPEIVLLLQPTSPLRTEEHLRRAVQMLREGGADSVVSVCEVPRRLSPDYVMRIDEGELKPFLPKSASITRRQDARPAYERDGTVYAFWTRTLTDHQSIYGRCCLPLLVPAAESLALDSLADWDKAERLLGERAAARL
jgi:CMP-N-acetylneuraminic acid synthetase